MVYYKERLIYSELKDHLSKKYITVITGLRRTGKTTLLKKLLEDFKTNNKIYIDLERIDNRELFSEKNYENIITALSTRGINFTKKTLIAIDEVQLLPDIVSVIKYLYDNYPIKFVITGSSTYYIKNLFSESLAGRKKVFELYTLNFREFLTFKDIEYSDKQKWKKFIAAEYERLKKYYDEFIRFGGFPEVVLSKSISDKKDIVNDILSSYLNIDIKNIADIRDQKNLHNLLKMVATRVCTRLDYSKLSSLTGISRPSVYNYLDLLENTFVIKRVPVFSKNRDREIVKAPKIFICDNGLLNQLVEVSSGIQFENAVFNQLKFYGDLQYYSLKTGKEIDFILNGNTAIEVKERATIQDKKQLESLAKGINISKNFIIARYPSPTFHDFMWGGDLG
ncbi:ATP-binding protein [Melioribacteraceae bacterium 4301-Me]|uniref:ATP-binding protein n=1 Tax=Pyranulibacter aquaticus TaxID=3163344 RepID=UPI00359BE7F9